MSPQGKKILAEALALPPIERASLVEELLSSFDFPSCQEVDALWAAEAEGRIDAYDAPMGGLAPVAAQVALGALQSMGVGRAAVLEGSAVGLESFVGHGRVPKAFSYTY